MRKDVDWATKRARDILLHALHPMTHGKCSFCERVLDPPQIDHHIPKGLRPELAFEWTNLFLVCGACNRAKGDTDPGKSHVKPDVDDPEPLLWVGPEGKLEPHPAAGDHDRRRIEETITLFGLQRGALVQMRSVWAFIMKRLTEQLKLGNREVIKWVLAPERQHKLVVYSGPGIWTTQ